MSKAAAAAAKEEEDVEKRWLDIGRVRAMFRTNAE